jgi:hypothetical protein
MVRLAARRVFAGKNVVALSHQEIAIASGIRLSRVIAISFLLSWDDVTNRETEAFCRACNFDPTNSADRERQREYIRTCLKKHPERPPHYLVSSPHWQEQFLPLIQHLKSQSTFSSDSNQSASLETKSAA